VASREFGFAADAREEYYVATLGEVAALDKVCAVPPFRLIFKSSRAIDHFRSCRRS
jgi:hypothetical protein